MDRNKLKLCVDVIIFLDILIVILCWILLSFVLNKGIWLYTNFILTKNQWDIIYYYSGILLIIFFIIRIFLDFLGLRNK
ncbi:MAG: hypothetical protein AABX54_04730 [Nanoarchaeota archaeon]